MRDSFAKLFQQALIAAAKNMSQEIKSHASTAVDPSLLSKGVAKSFVKGFVEAADFNRHSHP
ncbi:hypothetical protein [Limnohabitans sp. TS-CS-82]|uniref:hypothetical protein n=1 Tax=Limnohabitans sp. TS-CS-82 TaxID=2094193 RepID=UPI00191C0C69|nr:hypothetical protein [Limnohabitans sp. TS-CS-82]